MEKNSQGQGKVETWPKLKSRLGPSGFVLFNSPTPLGRCSLISWTGKESRTWSCLLSLVFLSHPNLLTGVTELTESEEFPVLQGVLPCGGGIWIPEFQLKINIWSLEWKPYERTPALLQTLLQKLQDTGRKGIKTPTSSSNPGFYLLGKFTSKECKGTEVLSILFQLLALGKVSVTLAVTRTWSRWAEY